MSGAAARIELPEILDVTAAAPLARELRALRGQALAIDASTVMKVGTQCLQVLVAAAATWQSDGVALMLENPSEALGTGIELLGLAPDIFSTPGVSE